MHFSDDPNNFRNKRYIDFMEEEFKNMFNAYHKYISYRNKLLKELTTNEEQREQIKKIDEKFINNLDISYKKVHKDSFKDNLNVAEKHVKEMTNYYDLINEEVEYIYNEYLNEFEKWDNKNNINLKEELFKTGKRELDKLFKQNGFNYISPKSSELNDFLKETMLERLVDLKIIER